MRSALIGATALVLFATNVFGQPANGAGQSPGDLVRPDVVIVDVKGVSANGNSPVAEEGSGFFISNDGFIVTAFHLLSDLGPLLPGTDQYEVHLQRFNATALPAMQVYADKASDLMVLHVPSQSQPYPFLKPGDPNAEHVVLGVTPIFAAGYPAGLDYLVVPGTVASWNGPITPLIYGWTTNMSFKNGQSGAPVFVADGHVIAFVKGVDLDASQIGYVVPIKIVPPQYWDGSLRLTPVAAAALSNGSNSVPTVQINATAPPIEPQPKTVSISFKNSACAGPSHQTKSITVDPGWQVKPNTINIAPGSSKGSVQVGIESRGAGGFVIGADLTNDGSCVGLLGYSLSGDTPAEFHSTVTYYQIPQNAPPETTTVAAAAALGNVTLPLPPTSDAALSFSLMKADGDVVSFAPNRDEILSQSNGQQVLNISKIVERVAGTKGN